MAAAGLLSAASAHAQATKFGLKAGALVNQDQYNNRFGFHGGGMLNIGLLDKDFLSSKPEVLYSQKGFKYADQSFSLLGNTYRSSGNVRYDYLDVPILLKLKTNGVFFEVGPQYSYLLNATSDVNRTFNGGVVSSYGSGTADLRCVNRNERGYVGGIGYQSRQGALISVRYNGAFTDCAQNGYSNNDFRNARHSA